MIDMLAERVRAMAAGGRVVIGICGIPGAGKTTLARGLVAALEAHGTAAAHLPMDGFHLSAAALESRGLTDRKGAPDTFDVEGYVAKLREVRAGLDLAVWAPDYDRGIHDVVPKRLLIRPHTRVIVTEGNYLALDEGPWAAARGLMTELWGVETPWTLARERLVARRVATGREHDAAVAWVDSVDRANAELVAPSVDTADVVVGAHELF